MPPRRPPSPAPARHVCTASGQTLPLVALLVAVLVGSAVLVGHLGRAVVDRGRARQAADAAALAGAVDGDDAARRLAAANGGVVERIDHLPDRVVEVTVRVGDARATSRAEPHVTVVPSPPPG